MLTISFLFALFLWLFFPRHVSLRFCFFNWLQFHLAPVSIKIRFSTALVQRYTWWISSMKAWCWREREQKQRKKNADHLFIFNSIEVHDSFCTKHSDEFQLITGTFFCAPFFQLNLFFLRHFPRRVDGRVSMEKFITLFNRVWWN